jgi:K+-transporting ATPase ATPase C chain
VIAQIFPAIRATLVLALLLGLVFPLAMTLISQLIFPEQAGGSLIRNKDGQVIGSRLLAQQFTKPGYFHPRPSAAGSGYAGEASGGTNLGPTSSKLINGIPDDPATPANESFDGIKQLAERYARENLLTPQEKAPVDAVTRSGSGLDPHISLANAKFQARRVAKDRGLTEAQVGDLIIKNTVPRQFGFLGEPAVNVLTLNMALDEMKPNK